MVIGSVMKKKQIIIFSSIAIALLIVIITLVCYFNIPRISYNYDSETDSYYVSRVFGNAKSYEIAEKINDKYVTKIGSKAFMNKDKLEKVILSPYLTEIERMAFSECHNLKEIDLSCVEIIGRNSFEGCSSLESIELNASTILGGAFLRCTSMKNVSLANTDSIGSYAFAFTAIKEIILPASMTLVGVDAFYGCTELIKIVCKSNQLKNSSYLNSLEIVVFDY